MRKFFLVFVVLLIVASAFADSFEDFKKQDMTGFENSKQEFSSYKKETDKAFEYYKKIIEEEFQAYKEQIQKNWGSIDVSTNTRWVEYLNNYHVRKTVDYENKDIKIDIIGGSSADVKPVLKDLLKEDRANAFRRDPVAYNTDKRLQQTVKGVETAKVGTEPVIAGLFTDGPMTDNEADTLADKLLSQARKSEDTNAKGKKYLSVTISLPNDTYKKSAEKITPSVRKYADKFQMDSALVMSVIYNESRFNPLAKSYVPAYGLMQIVPNSAGKDATRFLEGRERVLAPSYLYVPDNNVKIGAAYLHILYYTYLKGIKDPKSRLYCSIAAYNTGAGNVAYAFNGDNGRYNINKAVRTINGMSSLEVYNQLESGLRYEEARKYLVNVTSKMKDY